MTDERTLDSVIHDLVAVLLENIDELKNEPKSDWNEGKMFAYFECLTRIQCEMMPNEERYGLDGDLEEKYGLTEYLNR